MSNRKIKKGVKETVEEKVAKSSSKQTRSKRFSQIETDLLCRLVLSSDINSMVTNKMTVHGRLSDWEDIARVFNSSPGVEQRGAGVLKERANNIKKDLKKLAQYTVACTMATGGGLLPPTKPPKVSFELSEAVKDYATSLQVKLTGFQPMDSDAPVMTEDTTQSQNVYDDVNAAKSQNVFDDVNTAQSQNVFDDVDTAQSHDDDVNNATPTPRSVEPELLSPTSSPWRVITSIASSSPVASTSLGSSALTKSTTVLSTSAVASNSAHDISLNSAHELASDSTHEFASNSALEFPSDSALEFPSSSNTSRPVDTTSIRSSTQFFATQKQRSQRSQRKRNMDEPVSQLSGSSNSSGVPRDKYYESKAELLAGENRRRDEWHVLCVDLKKEELAIKKKQAQLWDVALAALQQNKVRLIDFRCLLILHSFFMFLLQASITDITNIASSLRSSECPVEYSINYPGQNRRNVGNSADAETTFDLTDALIEFVGEEENVNVESDAAAQQEQKTEQQSGNSNCPGGDTVPVHQSPYRRLPIDSNSAEGGGNSDSSIEDEPIDDEDKDPSYKAK